MDVLTSDQIVVHERTLSPNDGACLHATGLWVGIKAVSHLCTRLLHPDDFHECSCGHTWSIYDIDFSAA